jgi:hypothetical protein
MIVYLGNDLPATAYGVNARRWRRSFNENGPAIRRRPVSLMKAKFYLSSQNVSKRTTS